MSEIALVPPLAPPAPVPDAPGGRLHGLALGIAERLEGLLARAGNAEAMAEGLAFLRSLRQEAIPGLAPPGAGSDPLDRLVAAFRLSPVEADLLLLAGLAEEHEGLCFVLRGLHPRGEPRPTVALASQLFCRDADERRSLRRTLSSGPAVAAGLLRIGEEGPFPERSLLPAEALWPALHGLDVWPAPLAPVRLPAVRLGLDGWLGSPECRRALALLAAGDPVTLLVTADREEAAFERAAALVAEAGVPAVRLRWPEGPLGREAESLLAIHTVARGAVPVVRLAHSDDPSAPEPPALHGVAGPLVLAAKEGFTPRQGARPLVALPVPRLRPAESRALWLAALPELAESAPVLAARYRLEPAVAAEVVADARAFAGLAGRPVTLDEVAASVRTRCAVELASGLNLIRPSARWEGLVLRPDRLGQMREAVDRLLGQERVLDDWQFLAGRPGARGVRLLFAGPPGTGKTLSAEVLAHTLGVDLLLVDISRVVSKWIGQTEKNLAQVFDAAERSTAVLLFDEADALFGKRTEVSDAHDRYANLETAYLLSRLERFEGMAILSTNLRQNIDPAFLRRLEFVVDFEEPGMAERATLWRCHLPAAAPLAADVDLGQLASLYPIVGGLIRNAAVAAAFQAAAAGTPITQTHLVRAVRREYEKSGRPFPGFPPGTNPLGDPPHGDSRNRR